MTERKRESWEVTYSGIWRWTTTCSESTNIEKGVEGGRKESMNAGSRRRKLALTAMLAL